MPSQAKPISREYRIYLALWRKALTDPDWNRQVRCSSYTMAIAMRQGMYRAIRPFRRDEISDRQLKEAAEKFVAFIPKRVDDPKGEVILEFRERKALSELEAQWTSLGIDEEDLLLDTEKNVLATLEDLIVKEDHAPEVPRATTPFYTRES